MKAIVIGSGPAGISAALYLKRAGMDVTILAKDGGALLKTERIENYYGFDDPISGEELYCRGIAGAKRLGCVIKKEEVFSVEYTDGFLVKASGGEYQADAVLLATGASRKAPNIAGLQALEGGGVSYCAVCDAFFYRQKDVAVLGSGEYAAHEAQILARTSASVTILTNGAPFSGTLPERVQCDTRPVAKIEGEQRVTGVRFGDGDMLAVSGVFVAVGVASSTDLARKIGAQTEGSRIVADENGATNVPGLYAAGDCIGGLLQISTAVAEGAKAAMAMIRFLQKPSGICPGKGTAI